MHVASFIFSFTNSSDLILNEIYETYWFMFWQASHLTVSFWWMHWAAKQVLRMFMLKVLASCQRVRWASAKKRDWLTVKMLIHWNSSRHAVYKKATSRSVCKSTIEIYFWLVFYLFFMCNLLETWNDQSLIGTPKTSRSSRTLTTSATARLTLQGFPEDPTRHLAWKSPTTRLKLWKRQIGSSWDSRCRLLVKLISLSESFETFWFDLTINSTFCLPVKRRRRGDGKKSDCDSIESWQKLSTQHRRLTSTILCDQDSQLTTSKAWIEIMKMLLSPTKFCVLARRKEGKDRFHAKTETTTLPCWKSTAECKGPLATWTWTITKLTTSRTIRRSEVARLSDCSVRNATNPKIKSSRKAKWKRKNEVDIKDEMLFNRTWWREIQRSEFRMRTCEFRLHLFPNDRRTSDRNKSKRSATKFTTANAWSSSTNTFTAFEFSLDKIQRMVICDGFNRCKFIDLKLLHSLHRLGHNAISFA